MRPRPSVRTSRGARRRQHDERDDRRDGAAAARGGRGTAGSRRRARSARAEKKRCTSRPPTSMPDGTLVRQSRNAATSHTAHKTTTVAHRPMPRVAVISDVHANEQALLAVLEEIDAWEPEAIWCLGDVVGYGPAPNRCCQIVAERADVCLIGNHDLVALGTLDVADFNDEAAAAALWTRAALDERSRAFLSALEPSAVVGDVEMFHASPRDPVWEYVLSAETAYVSLVDGERAARARRPQPRRARDRPRRLGAARRPRAGGNGGRARRPLAAQPGLGRPAARRRPARRVARARHRREVCALPPRCISDRAHAGGDPGARASGARWRRGWQTESRDRGSTKWQS